MQTQVSAEKMFQPIEDATLNRALNALGRSINLFSTYGIQHPVFKQSIEDAAAAMLALFKARKKVMLGAFNGVLTVDEIPVRTTGTLQKSIERQLARLRITGLRIMRGISEEELIKLAGLLANREIDDFNAGIHQAGLTHIASEDTRYEAVQEGQTVANDSDLVGVDGNGILVLEDEFSDSGAADEGDGDASVHVDQIVAFLQGDIDIDDDHVAEELTELASDPTKLGQMIMESVSIRQSAAQLSGESLSDVILGCLRRTFDGLRKQPAFQTNEGVADLQKALLLLEEGMLDRIRAIAGEADTELDRKIVQAIQDMDESLGFELAANQYMEYREAIEDNKEMLKDYVRSKGSDAAEQLLPDSGFPAHDWKQIVVESREHAVNGSTPPIAAGLSTLTVIIEKLESLIKSDQIDANQVVHLLGEANNNLDNTTSSTKEKLETLSQQLLISDEDTGTIDGKARAMDRKELLSSLAEIAQELMQPLTAINTSLEMLLGGYVGKVSPEQQNLLSLATCSGDDLHYLMKELIEIVGIPTNRGVDKRFSLPNR